MIYPVVYHWTNFNEDGPTWATQEYAVTLHDDDRTQITLNDFPIHKFPYRGQDCVCVNRRFTHKNGVFNMYCTVHVNEPGNPRHPNDRYEELTNAQS